MQGRKRIIRDLGLGARADGQKRRLACIGQTDQTDIGDQLQPQPDPALFSRPALVRSAGRPVGAGFEVGVAKSAIAAFAEQHFLAVFIQIGKQCLAVIVKDLRADGHVDDDGLSLGTCAIGTGAIATLAGAKMLRVSKVDQGVQVRYGAENDVATASTIAAIRAAELNILLTTKRDDTIPAIAGAHIDLGLVEEFHRLSRLSPKITV